jgi:hypothetical protein
LTHSPDAVIHSPAENRRGLADDRHQVAMPARSGSKNTEAVLLLVEGDALDEAG